MKAAFTIGLLLLLLSSKAQFTFNTEIGGSNYTGFAYTLEYPFTLPPYRNLYISPKVGVGHIVYWDYAMTAQMGLALGKVLKNGDGLELNVNTSYIFDSPLGYWLMREEYTLQGGAYEDGNFLIYSGIDYRLHRKKYIWTIGLGAISIIYHYSPNYFEMEPEIIPMLKLGMGTPL